MAVELGADPGFPGGPPAGTERFGVEGVDSFRMLGSEAHLERAGSIRLLQPKRNCFSPDAEPGSQPGRPVENEGEAEWAERLFVETLARLVVADPQVFDDARRAIQERLESLRP